MTESTLTESDVQTIWLRALLTLAWADGDFDQREQKLVAELTHQGPVAPSDLFTPVTVAELQQAFGQDLAARENFLRTAVMVAIADGIYSEAEDRLISEFCQALGGGEDMLNSLRSTLVPTSGAQSVAPLRPITPGRDPLLPVRSWLDGMQIADPKVARFLCRMIPSQCPFERDVVLFGKKIVHIPPMCKINPLYEQLVGLRFRALSYLADDCGEDVTGFI
jgi:tellurite resistance protein